jgi:hypothetical protein
LMSAGADWPYKEMAFFLRGPTSLGGPKSIGGPPVFFFWFACARNLLKN